VATADIAPAGTVIHLPGFGQVKVFRLVAPDGDTQHWATNDLGMGELGRLRHAEQSWAVEEYHRGLKQYCGAEKAQVRAADAQRSVDDVARGDLLLSKGQFERAAEAYRRGLDENPHQAGAAYQLACLLMDHHAEYDAAETLSSAAGSPFGEAFHIARSAPAVGAAGSAAASTGAAAAPVVAVAVSGAAAAVAGGALGGPVSARTNAGKATVITQTASPVRIERRKTAPSSTRTGLVDGFGRKKSP